MIRTAPKLQIAAALVASARLWLLALLALSLLSSAAAEAGPAPAAEAKALSTKGAALFAKGEYLEAAGLFERAYALDAKDFRVLRYAGRAWQEIGHWERALTLLERYFALEPEQSLRDSVFGNLDKLRKATPRDKALALDGAARKYPRARLEDEAARALEAIGDTETLRKAIEQWEVARLSATEPTAKSKIEGELARVRDRLRAVEAAAARRADATSMAAAATPAAGPSTAQWALWSGGGVAVAAGAALWVVGAGATDDANAAYTAKKIGYATYTDQRAAADVKYFAGIGLVGAGALAAVAGLLLGPDDPRPTLGFGPQGLWIAGRF